VNELRKSWEILVEPPVCMMMWRNEKFWIHLREKKRYSSERGKRET